MAARELEELYGHREADRKPASLPAEVDAEQRRSSLEGTDTGVTYSAESTSSGPSSPATPSESSLATDPNEGGSAHGVLTHPLYEPWSMLKRDPKDEPPLELR